MKHVKIVFAAIAILFAAGTAVATGTNASGLPECPSTTNCQHDPTPECCFVDLGGGAVDIRTLPL